MLMAQPNSSRSLLWRWLPDALAMTSAKLMKQLDPGLSAMRSRPQLIGLLRLVNRRKACMGVLPLGLKSVLKEERADHIVMGVEFMPSGSPELVSSAEIMDCREPKAIHNPVPYWRGIIVGCAVFLLLAGAMAVQSRVSVVPAPGSEPRAHASVQTGSNTPSSPSPNYILPLQNGAEALSNSILVPAIRSSSAIPTIIQPSKDKSRLPGLPEIAEQPAILANIMDFAQIFRCRPGLLATACSAIEIKFDVSPEYPLGQIANVPGVLAKQLQQAVGDRLEGKPVKVSNGFRIDLSPLGTEAERNVRLLKERPSFEIPIAYAS